MAKLPGKIGNIYIMECRETGLVKLGRSGRPTERLRGLRNSSGTTGRDWVSTMLVDMVEAEKMMHNRFSSQRESGEYFRCSFDDASLHAAEVCECIAVATMDDVDALRLEQKKKSAEVKKILANAFYGGHERAIDSKATTQSPLFGAVQCFVLKLYEAFGASSALPGWAEEDISACGRALSGDYFAVIERALDVEQSAFNADCIFGEPMAMAGAIIFRAAGYVHQIGAIYSDGEDEDGHGDDVPLVLYELDKKMCRVPARKFGQAEAA